MKRSTSCVGRVGHWCRISVSPFATDSHSLPNQPFTFFSKKVPITTSVFQHLTSGAPPYEGHPFLSIAPPLQTVLISLLHSAEWCTSWAWHRLVFFLFFFHFHLFPRGEASVSQVQSGNSVQPAHVQTEDRTRSVFGRWTSRSTSAAFWMQFVDTDLFIDLFRGKK